MRAFCWSWYTALPSMQLQFSTMNLEKQQYADQKPMETQEELWELDGVKNLSAFISLLVFSVRTGSSWRWSVDLTVILCKEIAWVIDVCQVLHFQSSIPFISASWLTLPTKGTIFPTPGPVWWSWCWKVNYLGIVRTGVLHRCSLTAFGGN